MIQRQRVKGSNGISSSKKGSNEQIQNESHDHRFPERQTVNGAFYLEVLRRLKRRVDRVKPAIAGNWKLHHDNAPSSKVTDYLTQNGVATIPQPPYSPHLAPAEFFLLPKVNTPSKNTT